jgi:hypothetical protein
MVGQQSVLATNWKLVRAYKHTRIYIENFKFWILISWYEHVLISYRRINHDQFLGKLAYYLFF